MTFDEINDTHPNVRGLCRLARELGYRDTFSQGINSDGSVSGDLLSMLDDNPDLCSVMIEWLSEHNGEEEETCEVCCQPECLGCEEDQESEMYI